MQFEGFTKSDFNTFHIEGLDARMAAIEERIRPKFRTIGQIVTDDLSLHLGQEMFLHIAKHARRTVNPPKDTWLAIAANKRGYKQHPHFQIGLFDDHVFIWLAFIYELPNKAEIARAFLNNLNLIEATVPKNFLISQDHMKKDVTSMNEIELTNALERFRDIKKAEFLIGRHFAANDPILANGNDFTEAVKSTFKTLIPLYHLSFH
ncbi:DUF1054 domain-containing protein [Ectobacillus sp. JY-23]|uniref:YktB family protein n=1 Tax=Ectobacillus sp. JY-23 TaxID=2933872 RepID=UPI001FF55977|nr:DUF1054 domain-containing protein [Ectobacillus sp. JY-23]UOY94473.1 DUF1054 domain-containing protein [Ectobacillus sp. JY-23]